MSDLSLLIYGNIHHPLKDLGRNNHCPCTRYCSGSSRFKYSLCLCRCQYKLLSQRSVIDYYYQWAYETVSTCPADLKQCLSLSLGIIRQALEELVTSYQHPIPALVPRPALILLGHLACSIYLLEHALWSYSTGEPTKDTDIEVFVRWTVEGGTLAAISDVKKAKESGEKREATDSAIVFGALHKSKL